MMTSLQTIDPSSPVTMSTVDIALMVEKRHTHLLHTARKVLADEPAGPNLGRLNFFEITYTDQQGKKRACLRLPFRETMIVLTRISTPHASKVVDRWIELEREKAAVVALPATDEPPAELFPPNALERLTGTNFSAASR